ncbi:MAG: metallophosphoesterase family protein [Chloroflexota bacterium]|nr:metallophosphoesterase family protein [Chloroflexota bacterium]
MNVGVISDIHGDFQALVTALDRLDQYHKVDTIICAGDLIGRGPQPDEVVTVIRERRIPTVRGNHDELSYALSPENRAFLRDLPLDWRASWEGRELFMCHGKPGNNLWGLYRDHISDTLLSMMLKSLNVGVLITGHTHIPLYARVGGGCVVNPGSLYTFNNARVTSHTYGVLNLATLNFEVYDVQRDTNPIVVQQARHQRD